MLLEELGVREVKGDPELRKVSLTLPESVRSILHVTPDPPHLPTLPHLHPLPSHPRRHRISDMTRVTKGSGVTKGRDIWSQTETELVRRRRDGRDVSPVNCRKETSVDVSLPFLSWPRKRSLTPNETKSLPLSCPLSRSLGLEPRVWISLNPSTARWIRVKTGVGT